MSEWRRGTIGELARGHRGVSYAAGQLRQLKSSDTVTLLRSNNINSGRLNFEDIQIVPARIVADEQVLRSNDIAVCMSNGSKALVGKAAPFVGSNSEVFTVGAFCSVFRPNEKSEASFVNYVFQSKEYRKNLDLALAGTAINNLKNSDIEAFGCDIPPPEDQAKIAEILDTLETAIHETEAIIAKLNAFKQGLLHDLLTRGIDANGELRPPQSEAPHLYKDSPLGWIPQEWSCGRLADLIDVQLGFAFSSHDYVDDGVLSFRVTNIGQSFNDLGGVVKLPKDFLEKFPKQRLEGGEIMIVMVGATTGKMGRVPHAVCPALQNQNMWNLVPKSNLDRDFAWMALPTLVERHLKQAQGSARDFLTQSAFLTEYLAVPPPSEQTVLVHGLSAIDSRLENENSFAEKLRIQKMGLMNDLLTGRVRVTQLLTESRDHLGGA